MLTGKNILLGVSGGIAAYKMANVASMLTKLHADVHVMMTRNATHFIPAETFEVLTKNKVYLDTFDERPDDEVHVPHISLGTGADCILIAPATADVIGKLANGIADDMLSTTVLRKFDGRVEADEIGLPVTGNGLLLPCGCAGRYTG